VNSAGRRFPWAVYIVLLVLILLLGVAPLISALTAGAIADAHGCQLDEGGVHPCLVGGTDWGENLYTMGVLGWLMLASFPLGVMALVVLAIVLGIHRYFWSRKEGAP
jgi:hypothetical protein